jgi:hypothetical protein
MSCLNIYFFSLKNPLKMYHTTFIFNIFSIPDNGLLLSRKMIKRNCNSRSRCSFHRCPRARSLTCIPKEKKIEFDNCWNSFLRTTTNQGPLQFIDSKIRKLKSFRIHFVIGDYEICLILLDIQNHLINAVIFQ